MILFFFLFFLLCVPAFVAASLSPADKAQISLEVCGCRTDCADLSILAAACPATSTTSQTLELKTNNASQQGSQYYDAMVYLPYVGQTIDVPECGLACDVSLLENRVFTHLSSLPATFVSSAATREIVISVRNTSSRTIHVQASHYPASFYVSVGTAQQIQLNALHDSASCVCASPSVITVNFLGSTYGGVACRGVSLPLNEALSTTLTQNCFDVDASDATHAAMRLNVTSVVGCADATVNGTFEFLVAKTPPPDDKSVVASLKSFGVTEDTVACPPSYSGFGRPFADIQVTAVGGAPALLSAWFNHAPELSTVTRVSTDTWRVSTSVCVPTDVAGQSCTATTQITVKSYVAGYEGIQATQTFSSTGLVVTCPSRLACDGVAGTSVLMLGSPFSAFVYDATQNAIVDVVLDAKPFAGLIEVVVDTVRMRATTTNGTRFAYDASQAFKQIAMASVLQPEFSNVHFCRGETTLFYEEHTNAWVESAAFAAVNATVCAALADATRDRMVLVPNGLPLPGSAETFVSWEFGIFARVRNRADGSAVGCVFTSTTQTTSPRRLQQPTATATNSITSATVTVAASLVIAAFVAFVAPAIGAGAAGGGAGGGAAGGGGAEAAVESKQE